MRTSRKLERLTNWILDGKHIQINKIETNKHEWKPKLDPEETATTVAPETTLKNVIANFAILNTGSFHRLGDVIIARFVENDKTTLIVTEWTFPKEAFNAMVHTLTYGDTTFKDKVLNQSDVTSIESKFYTSSYEPI